jgi:sterol desaturase/sphingolipid hydroxylase (fatty acid hydroxylase superfamily)
MITIDHFEKLESYLPAALGEPATLMTAGVFLFAVVAVRYVVICGIFQVIFVRKSLPSPVEFPYLHDHRLRPGQISSEILWSLSSSLIFALAGLLIALLWQSGISRIYLRFGEHGLWYLPISFVLLCVIHEIYFYGTHVWMHRPKWYRLMHRVHHQSLKTTAWTSFSFHPLEAIVHALFLPVMILWLPLHPTVLIAYLTFMTLTAVSNHLGVEIVPFAAIRSWFISGEHHARHHRNHKCNFGLYFCFVDRIFGTEDRSEAT